MSEKDLVTEREKTLQAYQRLFESADGQKVLQDMMSSCFFKESTFSDNPQEFAFNEGQRAVILRIINTLRTDIGTYKRQVEEYIREQGRETWGF